MFEQKVEVKKKRDFGDVLNVSYAFIRQEYRGLGLTLLRYAGIPVLVLAILSAVYVDTSLTDLLKTLANPEASKDMVNPMPGRALLYNLISVIVQIFLSGLVYCYIVMYANKGAGIVEPKEVWYKFTTFFGAFLGYNILTGLVLVVAFSAFIIPGFYVMVPLSLILIVKVAEDKNYGFSFARCFYLVKNHWWETFGLILIATIVMLLLSSIFSAPAGMVAEARGTVKPEDGTITLPLLLAKLVSTVGAALVTPIPAVVVAFQYYSLVERKDNTASLYKVDKMNDSANSRNE